MFTEGHGTAENNSGFLAKGIPKWDCHEDPAFR